MNNLTKVCIITNLLLLANAGFAATIKIGPNTVVWYPKMYNNVTLDLSNGSFIIKEGATLTIKNSVINGTLSKDSPVLITVDSGKLKLDGNQVNIKTKNLSQHPQTQSLEYVTQVTQGHVIFNNNTFSIDQPFTAGLLITTSSMQTNNFQMTDNTFSNFHGVLYLINSNNTLVSGNTFNQNSYGHIVVIGDYSQILNNSIYFSGRYNQGDSIDIIDSSNVTISNNTLFTPTCHGIYLMNSSNVLIDSNRITGGITYAMNILSYPETMKEEDKYLLQFINRSSTRNTISNNITITNNYMAQNRYGIAANDVNSLNINGNTFVQRFSDASSRQFWTNNDTLLQNISNLTWGNNLYKEAYTQDINGDNSKSSKFVVFPQSGGVVLQ